MASTIVTGYDFQTTMGPPSLRPHQNDKYPNSNTWGTQVARLCKKRKPRNVQSMNTFAQLSTETNHNQYRFIDLAPVLFTGAAVLAAILSTKRLKTSPFASTTLTATQAPRQTGAILTTNGTSPRSEIISAYIRDLWIGGSALLLLRGSSTIRCLNAGVLEAQSFSVPSTLSPIKQIRANHQIKRLANLA